MQRYREHARSITVFRSYREGVLSMPSADVPRSQARFLSNCSAWLRRNCLSVRTAKLP
jgi:hypothetical protein